MELMKLDKGIKMTSLEVVDLINRFRKEEGKSNKEHFTFMRNIRNELKALENVGITNQYNFVCVNQGYKDSKGEWRPYYILNKYAILQMANRESALVRYRTQEYIEALETRLSNIQSQRIISEKDKQIKRLESLIGLRTEHKFQYGKIIKNHLGIKKADKDYEEYKTNVLL